MICDEETVKQEVKDQTMCRQTLLAQILSSVGHIK